MALSCCAGAALVSLGSLLLLLSTTATLLPIIAAAAADPAVRNTGAMLPTSSIIDVVPIDGGGHSFRERQPMHGPPPPPPPIVPVTNVSGLLGRNARLPCDTSAPGPDHPLLLVIWFKEPSTDPVYSYDVRGNGVEIGRHWNDGVNLGARARFENDARPPAPPVLWIDDLREEDRGAYRCRVDFRQAPTRNARINLQVIVPPGRPLMHNERGILVEDVLGPYNEGAELMLTCSVSGGRPAPDLHWLINGIAVSVSESVTVLRRSEQKATSVAPPTTVVSSSLMVGTVQRKNVDTSFTCLASNSNMTQASRAEVTLQMNLLPLFVHIKTARSALSAERVYDIHCITFGSRPSALVSWWLGNTQLLDHSTSASDAGNVTKSTLRYQPKAAHLGEMLRCRAENPVMPASQIEDTWSLDINYLPRVSLKFGSTLDPTNIKENDDVYFECGIKAKPWVYKIEWKFEGSPLRQDLRRGIIMGNQSLVLQRLGRNASGTYYCIATNSEGSAYSNPIQLDIRYKPVCADHQKMVYGVAHGEIASINCSVKANPAAGLAFTWTFNSSSELNTLPDNRFRTAGSTSQLVYSLNTGRDYGTILCWARNELGAQAEPCVFHLIPAVPPSPPQDCRISNGSVDGLRATCQPGFDGGLPQSFLLEVRIGRLEGGRSGSGGGRSKISDEVLSRTRSVRPDFVVSGLAPGTEYSIEVSSLNAKGRSTAVRLVAKTDFRKNTEDIMNSASAASSAVGVGAGDIKYSYSAEHTVEGELKPRVGGAATFPEKQSTLDSPPPPSSNAGAAAGDRGATGDARAPPSTSSRGRGNMEPFLSIVGGIGCGVILITVVLLVTIRMRCGGGGNGERHGLGSGRSRLRSDDNSAGGSSKLLSAQSSNLPIDHMSTWKTTDSGCLTENSSVVSVVASNQRDDLLQASPEFPGQPVVSAASLDRRHEAARTMSRAALLSSLSQQQQQQQSMPIMPPNLMPTAAGRRRQQQPTMAPGTSFTLRLTSSGRCHPPPPGQQQQQHRHHHHLHHHNPMAATAGSATMLLPPAPPPPPPPRRVSMTTATLPRGIHLGGTRMTAATAPCSKASLNSGGGSIDALPLLQNGLPSPPKPPQPPLTMAALALDLAAADHGLLAFPAPPHPAANLPPLPPPGCDVVIPPPAECLYTLPRPPPPPPHTTIKAEESVREVRFSGGGGGGGKRSLQPPPPKKPKSKKIKGNGSKAESAV